MTRRHISIEPSHPGALVAEVIEAMGISKSEMARRLQISRAALYNVLEERSALSAALALRLEAVTGTSAGLLVRMQADHDLWQARAAMKASA
jgi:addiction module HigA family antidote